MDSSAFLERYPLFSGLKIEVIESELSLSSIFVPIEIWTDVTVRETAIFLLTAHNLAIEYYDQILLGNNLRMTEIGEPIKERDLSNQNYFNLTRYGVRFTQLQQQILGLAIFVP
jgi:hypothetical protein